MQLIPKGRRSYSTDLWPLAVWKSGIINSSEFLVVLVKTADLLTNFDVKYAEAHPVMHLNTKTASRRYSCCLTGNQHYMPGIEYIFAKYRSYIWPKNQFKIVGRTRKGKVREKEVWTGKRKKEEEREPLIISFTTLFRPLLR